MDQTGTCSKKVRGRAQRSGLPIAVVGRVIDLMDEKTVPIIVATIDAVEAEFGIDVGLVIIDTLPKAIAAGGGDEDRAKDQGRVYANLQRVKERRNVHVALVCHPGKDVTRGPRGSNASTADFDAQIEISGTDIRTATVTKANDMPEGPIASFKPKLVSFGDDEDGDPVEVCIAEAVDGQPFKTERVNLSKKEQTMLDGLAEALADRGVPPPAMPEIPPSVKCVVWPDLWREYVRNRGITTSDKTGQGIPALQRRVAEPRPGRMLEGQCLDRMRGAVTPTLAIPALYTVDFVGLLLCLLRWPVARRLASRSRKSKRRVFRLAVRRTMTWSRHWGRRQQRRSTRPGRAWQFIRIQQSNHGRRTSSLTLDL
jgi:hypothetical protein